MLHLGPPSLSRPTETLSVTGLGLGLDPNLHAVKVSVPRPGDLLPRAQLNKDTSVLPQSAFVPQVCALGHTEKWLVYVGDLKGDAAQLG